jgi:hypothetical protein
LSSSTPSSSSSLCSAYYYSTSTLGSGRRQRCQYWLLACWNANSLSRCADMVEPFPKARFEGGSISDDIRINFRTNIKCQNNDSINIRTNITNQTSKHFQ